MKFIVLIYYGFARELDGLFMLLLVGVCVSSCKAYLTCFSLPIPKGMILYMCSHVTSLMSVGLV